MGLFSSEGFYESFTPPSYATERGTINPMMWGTISGQMMGLPTAADYNMKRASLASVNQGYKDSLNLAKSDYAGRGVYDSGWMAGKQGQLLGQKAMGEADAVTQFWNNIMMRQMQAQGQATDVLAGARAGSGTYTQRG